MDMTGQTPRKIFWGWYVVAGAFITIGINYGARYCFGVFLKPMCEELGWSRSVVSFAASLVFLVYGTGGILSGHLLDRFAPRWLITAGATIAVPPIQVANVERAPSYSTLSTDRHVQSFLCSSSMRRLMSPTSCRSASNSLLISSSNSFVPALP